MKGYLLLVLLFLTSCFHAEAGFFVKAKPAHASAIHPVSSPGLWQKLRPISSLLGRFRSADGNDVPCKTNGRGIASLICIAAFIFLVVAAFTIMPAISTGLALLLDFFGLASSIAAIVLGARGLKRDRNKGYSIAGLSLGILVLTYMVLFSIILLVFMNGL